MTPLKFTIADVEVSGMNCGPTALAAICGLTLDEVRPHFGSSWPGYTNPTMMMGALRSIGVKWSWTSVLVAEQPPSWPRYGLCRIQWEGPWTQPGVPIAARYRYTHWIGAATRSGVDPQGAWDVNALSNGTVWMSRESWEGVLVPHLTAEIKRATGGWHITHAIEVERPT